MFQKGQVEGENAAFSHRGRLSKHLLTLTFKCINFFLNLLTHKNLNKSIASGERDLHSHGN
jgi:hypothetical protein